MIKAILLTVCAFSVVGTAFLLYGWLSALLVLVAIGWPYPLHIYRSRRDFGRWFV